MLSSRDETETICKSFNCNSPVGGHENYETGYCRKCWLNTVQEHSPGLDISGRDMENLMESE